MSILKNIPDEEIKAAQKRLNELCDKIGVTRFSIKDKKIKSKKWQTIVLRQCGLNIEDKDAGRPESPETWGIGSTALLLQDFGTFKNNSDLYDAVIESKAIKARPVTAPS